MASCGVQIAGLWAIACALSGCGQTDLWVYICANYDEFHKGPDGGSDPCHDADVDRGDAGTCVNECIGGVSTDVPQGWSPPSLLWSGPKGEELPCPYGGLNGVTYEGYDDLVAPLKCEACTCGLPAGSCALPSSLTAHSVICQDLGQPHTDVSFDAPAPWDGKCDGMSQVPAGALSLSIAPLTMMQSSCAVTTTAPQPVAPHWTTLARACTGRLWSPCGDLNLTCIDDSDPMFRVCTFRTGDWDCPESKGWTEKHMFYGDGTPALEKSFNDHRRCADCACGPPIGSTCTTMVSIDKDSACTDPLDWVTATSDPDFCINVPPGVALKGKSAAPPVYTSGMCAPMGGEPIAGSTIEKINPGTFCCKPRPGPVP